MEEYRYPWEINTPQLTQENILKKQLRREANAQGGALLIYKAVMNAAVFAMMIAVALVETILLTVGGIQDGSFGSEADVTIAVGSMMESMMNTMMEVSGWGYLLAIAAGFVLLLVWKRPSELRHTVLRKGNAMTFGSFLALVCLTFGCQLPAQLLTYGLDWVSRLLGGSFMEVLEQNSADTGSLAMWLYVCLLAPVAEEVLFRGVLLRSLEPYGKKFAIVVSSLLFGLFHGNPVQTPFAILAGLVFGYVAVNYHILWAIVLHMMNNLLLGDLLGRLLAPLPYSLADAIGWILLGAFFLAALLVLLAKWRIVAEKCAEEQVQPWQRKAFWGAPSVVILCILCGIDIAAFLMLIFV